jgi:sarcosine oxidase, subunit beta
MQESLAGKRVVIVGGGGLGCLIAYHLAGRLASVVVVERRKVGLEASGTNAGTLAVSNKEVRLGLLAARAVDEWATLAGELGPDCGYVRCGGLRVAAGDNETAKLNDIIKHQRALGLDVQALEGSAIRERAPYLSRDVSLASYCPLDSRCDPLHLTRVLADAAVARGAEIRTGCVVGDIRRNGVRWEVVTDQGSIPATDVVLALGAWNAPFLARYGISTPAQLRVNQLMVSEAVEPFLPYVVTNVSETLTLKQVPPGTFIIGGGWQGLSDFAAERTWPTSAAMVGNARAAVSLIPALRELNIVRAWARHDVRTADKLPICGPISIDAGGGGSPGEGLYIAGTGNAGLTFGPLVARWTAGMVTGEVDPGHLAPYRVDRVAVAPEEDSEPTTAGIAAGFGGLD